MASTPDAAHGWGGTTSDWQGCPLAGIGEHFHVVGRRKKYAWRAYSRKAYSDGRGYRHRRVQRLSAIVGASIALRELRVAAGRGPLRVFYAFDPARQAVLLIGGDKTGETSHRFYARLVPQAEAIWAEYLKETGQ